jgi:Uncharacterised protein family (UPF0236)
MATRAAMHRAGAAALTELLRIAPLPQPNLGCDCGERACYREMRPKHLRTALGLVEIQRPYYLCPGCHQGQNPRDRELDVEGTQYSPGVRRMMALVGSEASFDQSREQLALLAGIDVTAKAVERQAETIGMDIAACEQTEIQRAHQLALPEVAGDPIPVLYIEMDGTGVPVVATETQGRSGKNNAPARTREAKLGCVFTQTKFNQEGRPVRDEGSTTYTGAIEIVEDFARRIYAEAWQRGWCRAQTRVVLGDGAAWIWTMADLQFPEAIQIVDLYHAREHIWDLAAQLFPQDEKQRRRWGKQMQKKLDAGKIEQLVTLLRSCPTPQKSARESLSQQADYFETHKERMRYPKFRKLHLFVGSGVIEAGCKTVIGSRLKQSGMFWTVRGANAIIALRCHRLSNRFQDYWDARREAA